MLGGGIGCCCVRVVGHFTTNLLLFMNIEQAYQTLRILQLKGVENVVLAVWDAQSFDLQEGYEWACTAEMLEHSMDWSQVHDRMFEIIKEEKDLVG